MKFTFIGLILSSFALVFSANSEACGGRGCRKVVRHGGFQQFQQPHFQQQEIDFFNQGFNERFGDFNDFGLDAFELASLQFNRQFASNSEFLIDSTNRFAVNFRTGRLHPVSNFGRTVHSSTFLNTGNAFFDPRTFSFAGNGGGLPTQNSAFQSPFSVPPQGAAELKIGANNEWVQKIGNKEWPILTANSSNLIVSDLSGRRFQATRGDLIFEFPTGSRRYFLAPSAQALAQEYSKWWFDRQDPANQIIWDRLGERQDLAKAIVQRYYSNSVRDQRPAGAGFNWVAHNGGGGSAGPKKRPVGFADTKTLWDKAKEFYEKSSPDISLDKFAKKAIEGPIDVKCVLKGEKEPASRKLIVKFKKAKGEEGKSPERNDFKLGLFGDDSEILKNVKDNQLGQLLKDDDRGYYGSRKIAGNTYYPYEDLKISATPEKDGNYTFLLVEKTSEKTSEDAEKGKRYSYCWTGKIKEPVKKETDSEEAGGSREQVLAASAKIVAACIQCHENKGQGPLKPGGFVSDGTDFTTNPANKVAGINALINAVENNDMPQGKTDEEKASIVKTLTAWKEIAEGNSDTVVARESASSEEY